MTYYEIILTTLLDMNMVTVSALLALADSTRVMYRNLTKAESLNHISKHRIEIVDKSTGSCTVTSYYTLTHTGLSHLILHPPKNYEWLKQIPITVAGNASFVGSKNIRDKELLRFLSRTTIQVMSLAAGGTHRKMYFRTDISNPHLISNIVSQAMLSYRAEEELLPDRDGCESHSSDNSDLNSFRFTPAPELKQMLACQYNTASQYGYLSKLDFDRGRYCGLLENRMKAVLCYYANRSGMSWTAKSADYEIKSYRLIMSQLSNSQKCPDSVGIMFVKNRASFDALYTNSGTKSAKRLSSGNGFSHWYIVPVSRIGVSHLRWLMETDMEKHFRLLSENAIESGEYYRNNGTASEYFPICSVSNQPVYLGTDLDMTRIRRAHKVMEFFPDHYTVMCFPWQTEYYRSLFGNRTSIIEVLGGFL